MPWTSPALQLNAQHTQYHQHCNQRVLGQWPRAMNYIQETREWNICKWKVDLECTYGFNLFLNFHYCTGQRVIFLGRDSAGTLYSVVSRSALNPLHFPTKNLWNVFPTGKDLFSYFGPRGFLLFIRSMFHLAEECALLAWCARRFLKLAFTFMLALAAETEEK